MRLISLNIGCTECLYVLENWFRLDIDYSWVFVAVTNFRISFGCCWVDFYSYWISGFNNRYSWPNKKIS